MRINDLEYKTGLDRATIRYYEKEGMITPARTDNGYRDYSDEDLKHLLKIKLLRQLGMPLQKIMELQQGSADFQTALVEQIHALEVKRDTAQRSAQICRLMQSDGVTYASLNASYYLDQFRATKPVYPQTSASYVKPTGVFQESIPREYHPFRHLFARYLDLLLLISVIMFVQVVFFHVRTDGFIPGHIPMLLIWIPLEALCYAICGTTPGKLAFGIRVEYYEGGKMPLSAAFKRAFLAFRFGMGWGIPFWQLWRLYKSYKIYKEFEELEWNDQSEIIYDDFWSWKKKIRPVIVLAVLIALLTTSMVMINTPKYSGHLLTMEQFVSNHNEFIKRFGGSEREVMSPDGTFIEPVESSNVVSIVVNGRLDSDYPDLEYTVENSKIKGFSCTDSYTYRGMTEVLPDRYVCAILALQSTHSGQTTASLSELRNVLLDRIVSSIDNGIKHVVLENDQIKIDWTITYDGDCILTNIGSDIMLMDRSERESSHATIVISAELKGI